MWIENKADGLVGPARIGWAKVRDHGKRIDYRNQSFRSLRGAGFKANFYDIETREEYWITGCRMDGRNALYNTDVEIDQEALEEYWLNIRKRPENVKVSKFRARGKH
jgi:hypothetical protein